MIPAANSGLFVPTTNNWDLSRINDIDMNSPEFRSLLVRLYQNINLICLALNIKDSAYYTLNEFVNGQLYFPNPAYTSLTANAPSFRQVFRLVVNFGALPNTATKSVAHGLTPVATSATAPGWNFTRIYATASDTTGLTYIPIPSLQANLTVDAVNVNITTTANLTNYNICYVVLEYFKF